MEETGKLYAEENREIINDWSYDGTDTVASLPVWTLDFGCTECTLHKSSSFHTAYIYGVTRSSMVAYCSAKL
jgi:hypothetical protein